MDAPASVPSHRGAGTPQNQRRRKDAGNTLVVVDGEAELFQIIRALDAPCRFASCLDCRQEKRDQDGDDRDHHQELDERETELVSFSVSEANRRHGEPQALRLKIVASNSEIRLPLHLSIWSHGELGSSTCTRRPRLRLPALRHFTVRISPYYDLDTSQRTNRGGVGP